LNKSKANEEDTNKITTVAMSYNATTRLQLMNKLNTTNNDLDRYIDPSPITVQFFLKVFHIALGQVDEQVASSD